ncbi:MAG TPA: hypothetical protein VN721_16665 [Flavipsychrobacter sp.]|nr:hypothetical protein [Flavipsychrobacter sp.]
MDSIVQFAIQSSNIWNSIVTPQVNIPTLPDTLLPGNNIATSTTGNVDNSSSTDGLLRQLNEKIDAFTTSINSFNGSVHNLFSGNNTASHSIATANKLDAPANATPPYIIQCCCGENNNGTTNAPQKEESTLDKFMDKVGTVRDVSSTVEDGADLLGPLVDALGWKKAGGIIRTIGKGAGKVKKFTGFVSDVRNLGEGMVDVAPSEAEGVAATATEMGGMAAGGLEVGAAEGVGALATAGEILGAIAAPEVLIAAAAGYGLYKAEQYLFSEPKNVSGPVMFNPNSPASSINTDNGFRLSYSDNTAVHRPYIPSIAANQPSQFQQPANTNYIARHWSPNANMSGATTHFFGTNTDHNVNTTKNITINVSKFFDNINVYNDNKLTYKEIEHKIIGVFTHVLNGAETSND